MPCRKGFVPDSSLSFCCQSLSTCFARCHVLYCNFISSTKLKNEKLHDDAPDTSARSQPKLQVTVVTILRGDLSVSGIINECCIV